MMVDFFCDGKGTVGKGTGKRAEVNDERGGGYATARSDGSRAFGGPKGKGKGSGLGMNTEVARTVRSPGLLPLPKGAPSRPRAVLEPRREREGPYGFVSLRDQMAVVARVDLLEIVMQALVSRVFRPPEDEVESVVSSGTQNQDDENYVADEEDYQADDDASSLPIRDRGEFEPGNA